MDLNTATTGFRVLVRVDRVNEELMKCFIYVNLKKMKLIKDVEEHIRSLLDLDAISLYVNDVWLPSNETVKLIKEEDAIIAKLVCYPTVFNVTSKVNYNEQVDLFKRKKKKKDIDDDPTYLSLKLLHEELQDKKTELLQKQVKNSTELIATNNEVFSNDDLTSFLPPSIKKKRIRKHKKKTKKNITQSDSANPSPDGDKVFKEMKTSYSGVHTRFFDGKGDMTEKLQDEGSRSENIEPSTIVNNVEKATNDGHLDKEMPSEETCPGVCISDKGEDSIHMDISDQPCAENGPPVDEITISNNGNENSEQPEGDWKTALLGLVDKNMESKVFHRKFPTQDVTQTC